MDINILRTLSLTIQSRGGTLRRGVDLAKIRQFELNFNVTMPDDLRSYFTEIDGMPPGYADNELFRFHPLSEVQPLSDTFGIANARHHGYFVIADYCICSHFYAINLATGSDNGSVVRACGPDDTHVVWRSFNDFVAAYIEDSDKLLL